MAKANKIRIAVLFNEDTNLFEIAPAKAGVEDTRADLVRARLQVSLNSLNSQLDLARVSRRQTLLPPKEDTPK